MTTGNTTKDMLGRSGLMGVDQARDLLLGQLPGTVRKPEELPIDQALGRILAESVQAKENLPPHPRSVMDGFAVIAADTFGASESMPCYLQINGNVAMGEHPEGKVTRGNCFRIATGGFLPAGADAVVMLEHTVPVDETMVEVVKSVGTGTNLIGTGDDIRLDEQALSAGTMLRAQDLGLLAGLGTCTVKVFPAVRVGIVSTGDEIIHHTEELTPGKIRDINSIVLSGLVKQCGGEPKIYPIVSDTKEVFFPVLEEAVRDNDIVLFSGGSSVGVRDLGELAVESLGPPGLLVHGVALKPGKPVLIGLAGATPVFGLPGHPVSAMVCFELFVEPAISQLSGRDTDNIRPCPSVSATLGRNINSAAGRRDLVRVKLTHEDNQAIADPVMGKSGAISTLSRADGYFIIDEASQGVTQGSTIEVFIYT